MSVVTRCGAVSLLVGLLLGGVPAHAQTSPGDAGGSSWTDPPVRGSAGPELPAPAKPDAKPPAKAEAPVAADSAKPEQRTAGTPAERAAASLGVQPVQAKTRSAEERRARVRPRMVERPMVISRRPGRLVEQPSRRLAQRYAGPVARSYAFRPASRSYGRVDPYDGRSYGATWSSRRLAGWGELVRDNPASRAARAGEDGYAVMRMRTYEYPDGTRFRRLTPYDGAAGDLD